MSDFHRVCCPVHSLLHTDRHKGSVEPLPWVHSQKFPLGIPLTRGLGDFPAQVPVPQLSLSLQT